MRLPTWVVRILSMGEPHHALKARAPSPYGRIRTFYTANRGRPGFDVGIDAAQGMPRGRSPRKSILQTHKRQRRAFRSSRLIPARRCTGLLMGQAFAAG